MRLNSAGRFPSVRSEGVTRSRWSLGCIVGVLLALQRCVVFIEFLNPQIPRRLSVRNLIRCIAITVHI